MLHLYRSKVFELCLSHIAFALIHVHALYIPLEKMMMREAREPVNDMYDLSEEGHEEEADWECVVNDAQLSEIRDAMSKELRMSISKMERDLREKLSKQNGALIALLQNRILSLEHDVLKLKMAAVDCSCTRHQRYTQDTKDKRQQRVSDDIPLSLFVSRYRMHREVKKAAEQRQIARSTSSQFVTHLIESAIAKVHQDHRLKVKAAQVLHLFVTQRRKFALVIQELKEHLVHTTLTRRVHRVKKINALSRWREFITDKEIKSYVLESAVNTLRRHALRQAFNNISAASNLPFTRRRSQLRFASQTRVMNRHGYPIEIGVLSPGGRRKYVQRFEQRVEQRVEQEAQQGQGRLEIIKDVATSTVAPSSRPVVKLGSRLTLDPIPRERRLRHISSLRINPNV
eukprot:GILJ01007413.1.p1 GENE.GILJ01007413.1~~GILJ01007413.1.p1  ORF type:complete len:400 (+),score=60.05 GILJ01007413.1:120-1319(+)